MTFLNTCAILHAAFSMTIHTPSGEVSLVEPDPARLRNLRQMLPMGAVRFGEPKNGAHFGIVMKVGEREVYGVKQQPPDFQEESWAKRQFFINSLLIAHTLRSYLNHGYSGVFMPCAYWRVKGERHEVGVAYFGAPSPSGIESNEFEFNSAWDDWFGHGFSQMLISFIQALKASQAESGFDLQPTIGLDYRPRLALGRLGLGFLVQAQDVFALKTVVNELDPAWAALRSTGIEKVYHLPSIPIEIGEEQMPIAKPEA